MLVFVNITSLHTRRKPILVYFAAGDRYVLINYAAAVDSRDRTL